MGAQIIHWGRVTHVCVGKLAIIDSGNGLSPGRRQTIIWINARNIANWTLRNKLQWNFNTNSHIVIQENGFHLRNRGHLGSASMCWYACVIHYLNQWYFIYWRIIASLGLNELNLKPRQNRAQLTVLYFIGLFYTNISYKPMPTFHQSQLNKLQWTKYQKYPISY